MFAILASAALAAPAFFVREDGENPAEFDPTETYVPDVDQEDLRPSIRNEYFPAPVGARWLYRAFTDEGVETVSVRVLRPTTEVWDVDARVVRDTVYLNGELREDTWDWYAQDDDGHVWYLGEDTAEYEDGVVVCHCGAWETDVDGALPGVVMLADPEVGDIYRQEFYEGEAEDYAEVVEEDVTVTVTAGTFTDCIVTHDLSAIDSTADEYKTYCPGVGNVLTEKGDYSVELVRYSGL